MNEQKPSAQELLNQIAEFEATIASLQKNIGALKEKLAQNRQQFGEDVANWPKM